MKEPEQPLAVSSDAALMLRVRWGDEFAFEELYRRYFRKLLNFFYAMSRNPQNAEDLMQETFGRIWKQRCRYEPDGSFAAYVFAFARNIWLERCRVVRREHLASVDVPFENLRIPAGSAVDAPDILAERSEIEQQILSVLVNLPDEQRMAFVMRYVQRLSLNEIAEIMKCPVNTVRSRKLLAVRKLREALRCLYVV
ncbi:MAG: sigma-70 family RNA polymerase sigma factor [Candidatus Hydrogenedentes bacterium]|nr:sigma-70 family RNA polymerase sigma factor [Candidatus Hydrogenedentota bacterium]